MWGLEAKKAHPLGGPSALSSPLLVAAPLGVIPTISTYVAIILTPTRGMGTTPNTTLLTLPSFLVPLSRNGIAKPCVL